MLSAMAPHGREMSQDLRKKIISLHKKGEGYKKISKALLISQNTVAKVVQTFKKDGTATISQRHPRKLTPRQERLLMRRVEENWHASSLQLSKEVESQTGVTISHDTIRSQYGHHTRWGIQRKLHGAYSETWWWQCPYVGLHECYWCRGAAFHWWHHEFTNVLLYTEREDATSLRALGRRALFQHDNDPKHTSKATVGFLKKNRVRVIQWPSMSPDLNPIEHLWGILKRQVENHSPSSIQSLKEVILEEWKKIDLAKCRQLVHSMPRRLGAVIKNHGGHTKY